MSEILSLISTTEIVKSPIILRCEPLVLLAVSCVSLLIPVGPSEDLLGGVVTHWHHHVIASLITPSVAIEALRGIVMEWQAWLRAGVVQVDASSLLQALEVCPIECGWAITDLDLGFLGSRTCCFDWLSWQLTHEVGGVWVIDHGHRTEGVTQDADQSLDVGWVLWSFAEIECRPDLAILGAIVFKSGQVEEATSNCVAAVLSSSLLVHIGCKI